VANTLAYYNTATITAVKSFIVQALEYVMGFSKKTVCMINKLIFTAMPKNGNW
jgi:hypothetical protein